MHAPTRTSVAELFLGIWSLLARTRAPLLVASVSFTMLLAVGSAAVQFRVAHIEDGIMSQFSLDRDELRTTIDNDFAAIGAMNVSEFVQATNFGSNEFLASDDGAYQVGMTYLRRVSPIILLQLGFNMFVMFCAAVFFLLLFTRGSQSGYEVASRLPLYLIRMCGLVVWTLVRSLLWIPIVGPFIAMYMLPRLSLAPVFLASGEAGVFESLHLSMRRTSHKWLTVLLRLILIAIVALLILWPMMVGIVGVMLLSVKVGYILFLLAFVFITAFIFAGLTVLATMLA